MARLGMVIDLKRCVGCHACAVACKTENATPPGVFWSRVLEREEGKYPAARRMFVPVLCNHCKNPPCLTVCPTGATSKREDGVVLIDNNKCIGCRACIAACPYEARSFHKDVKGYFEGVTTPYEKQGYAKFSKGTVSKCTLCEHRIAQGLDPACVQTCIAKARFFGDLDDLRSEPNRALQGRNASQLLAELGTDPSVKYVS